MSIEAQEQLEAKDRIIQKLAANNKEKDNLIAVNTDCFLSVTNGTFPWVKQQEVLGSSFFQTVIILHRLPCFSGLRRLTETRFKLRPFCSPRRIISILISKTLRKVTKLAISSYGQFLSTIFQNGRYFGIAVLIFPRCF